MIDERLAVLLRQIRSASVDSLDEVATMSRDDFLADRRVQKIVAMNLIIVGEAASRVLRKHAVFAQSRPDIRWDSMSGMRNFIAHGYEDVNFDIVWTVVTEYTSPLVAKIDEILAEG